MGALAYNTEIQGDLVAVSQTKMRKRIAIRPEVLADGTTHYLSDVSYEPLVKAVIAVPLADITDTKKLSEAFKVAGVPVSTHEDIRTALMNLPHMKGSGA